MGLSKSYSFANELVDGRCLRSCRRIEATHIAVTHVVGKDENDVGILLCLVQEKKGEMLQREE
jgi:hypothetical protein